MSVQETALAVTPVVTEQQLSSGVLRKVAWRLLPLLSLMYLLNILDRANVGFARLTMQPDLRLSDAVFDFGYGIFYFGYFLFEVPANLLLRRVGARRWMARIMVTWGLVSCLALAVTGVWSFYAVRILLGIAEAGFFPGIVLYLTYWFPARERARAMAFFMMASALSGVVGNPISGAVLHSMNGLGGLHGWQWLFLIEGLPSVLLGFFVLWYLPDGPAQARWLTNDERGDLLGHLRREEDTRVAQHGADRFRAMLHGRVWLLIGVYATVAIGSNAAGAKFAQIIGGLFEGESTWTLGWLVALPHACAVLAMIVIGTHSDRTGERPRHVAFSASLGAVGWLVAWTAPTPWLGLIGLCIAQSGMMSMLPTFWAIPTGFLSGVAAAGGIALINSVANVGGLFGPNIFRLIGMPGMAVVLLTGAVLAICVRRTEARRDAASAGRSAA
jgi:ACS family tartrate transporter-like MFS transporter